MAPQQIAILQGNGDQLASISHGGKADLAVAPSSSGKGPWTNVRSDEPELLPGQV